MTSACTDTGVIVDYAVTSLDSLDAEFFHVSFNPYSNMVRISALTGGSASGQQTIEVTATMPDIVTSVTFTFNVDINICITQVFSAPVWVDQAYIVSDVYADYTFPDFGMTQTGCTQAYTNSISPANTWITDSSGVGRVVGWQTLDEPDMGTYTVTITVVDAVCPRNIGTASYTLEVTSPCEITPITIDSGDFVFRSPARTMDVWQPQEDIDWSDGDTIWSYSCSDMQFAIVDQADSAVDSFLFTVALDPTDGSIQTLSI